MLRIVVELEGKRVEARALADGTYMVGRSRQCDIKVNAPDISRSHVKITVNGGRATVENASQYGSKLDGQPLAGPTEFRVGQRLTIGEVVGLVMEDAPVAGASDSAARESLQAGVTMPDGSPRVTPGAPPSISAVPAGSAGMPADRMGADVSAESRRSVAPPPLDVADRTGDDVPRPAKTGGNMKTSQEVSSTGGRAPTAAAAAADDVHRTEASMDMGTEAGHTRAMQTRMVSPEELDQLRVVEQNRVRRRLSIGLAIGIPLLILAIVFRPRPRPPETELEWNLDAQGEYLEAMEPAPSGGVKDGGYDLVFPGDSRKSVKPVDGGVQVDFYIGRDRNVPMRVILQEQSDVRFVKMNRVETLEDWRKDAMASGGVWNPDPPYKTLYFIGKEQGIPLLRMSYERQGDGSWYGMACVMRHGQKRIVIRAEIPAAERLRGEKMLMQVFMAPSRRFEQSHWEADGAMVKTPVPDMLRDARREISRQAPATWAKVESILRSILTQAVLGGDAAGYKEGLELLQELRRSEAVWFNSQMFAKDNAEAKGSRDMAFRLKEIAKGVFSNPDDNRYYLVRKW